MAAVPKNFYRANAPVDAAPAVSTVPANKQWIITNIVATNSTTTARMFTVSLDGVPFVPKVQLQPSAVFTLDCAQVLAAGKNLSVSAEVAAAMAVHISGVEVDV